jgi:UDP-N-acetylmuramoyl-L-alanyl-D-glutamate--2,6-diaminopimelate ligase
VVSKERIVARQTRTLAELLGEVPGSRLIGDGTTTVDGIAYDSRVVNPGDLFCALVGGYFDGHDYVESAVQRGASAVIVERELAVDVPQIVVANSRAALAPISAAFFGHPSHAIPVIGITGTDGKTTTTYMLESIFAEAGYRPGVMGTIGVRIGGAILDGDTRQTTPESTDVQRHLSAMVESGADLAIVEATSHGLDLHRLDGVRFATAAVTNITHEHLEYHRTISAYRRAKAKLFEAVDETGGTAVINLDDEGARSMLPFAARSQVLTYGLDRPDVDIAATNIELSASGSRYALRVGDDFIRVESPTVGRFNVANATCAVAVAKANDISLETCANALSGLAAVPGRMQPVRHGQPYSIIVDYAHTPESVNKVLSLLRTLTPSGRLVLVMGSAGERDSTKRPLQGAVGARLADFCVFTTEDPRFESPDEIIDQIAAGAITEGAVEGQDFVRITDRREAIGFALSFAREGDCVLLAGKGHERSIIWGHEKRPWDEAAVAAEILAGLGFDQTETH